MSMSDLEKLKAEREMHELIVRSRSAETFYDRVALLVQCYHDDEFRQWCSIEGLDDMEILDKEISGVSATTFFTAKAVYERFPDREVWANDGFRVLIAKLMQEQKKQDSGNLRTSRINWKSRAMSAESEIRRLKAEIESLKLRQGN